MTASDIPECWSSSARMARALSTYIEDPRVVRRAVLDSFSNAPELATIRRYRAEYLAPKPADEPFKAYEGYYPADLSRDAEATTTEFLRRLRAERELSAWAA